jgi:ribosomal protein S18 acetylase RimI-like enzyme
VGDDDLLEFQDAVPADVAAIVALVTSAYRGEQSKAGWTTEADLIGGQRTDPEAVLEAISRPGSRMRLARAPSGDLVGCCQLERKVDRVCYFGMFAVSPVLQARGVGRRILDDAERVAREEWSAGTMEMTVITQRRDLIDWYVRRGYAFTGEMRAFPYGDERFGQPRRDDLAFEVLAKALA